MAGFHSLLDRSMCSHLHLGIHCDSLTTLIGIEFIGIICWQWFMARCYVLRQLYLLIYKSIYIVNCNWEEYFFLGEMYCFTDCLIEALIRVLFSRLMMLTRFQTILAREWVKEGRNTITLKLFLSTCQIWHVLKNHPLRLELFGLKFVCLFLFHTQKA